MNDTEHRCSSACFKPPVLYDKTSLLCKYSICPGLKCISEAARIIGDM